MNKARRGIIELEQMLANASEITLFEYDCLCIQFREIVRKHGDIGLLALAVVALECQEQFSYNDIGE